MDPIGQKPPAGAFIDWSHPLAAGLGYALVLNEGAGVPYDLVSGAPATLGGDAAWGDGGVTMTAGAISLGDYAGWDGSSQWTMVVHAIVRSASAFARIIGTWDAATSRLLTLNADNTLTVAIHDGSTPNVGTSADTIAASATPRLFAATQIGSNPALNSLIIHLDGRQISNTVSGVTPANRSDALIVGAGGAGGSPYPLAGTVLAVYIWPTRGLHDAEHAALQVDPYAFITDAAWQQWARWVEFPAAGGNRRRRLLLCGR